MAIVYAFRKESKQEPIYEQSCGEDMPKLGEFCLESTVKPLKFMKLQSFAPDFAK